MRYWIGVASKDHVTKGVAGGFCQLGHGKSTALKRMMEGDWIIYYSPKTSLDHGSLCQQFTAIGQLSDSHIYSAQMTPDFTAFRRNVDFLAATAADIHPLIQQLDCIKNKTHWGYTFRFGHLEITSEDFQLIAHQMQIIPAHLAT